ncbi:MAG: hypothetical protein WC187_05230 [Bacillota bacterium]
MSVQHAKEIIVMSERGIEEKGNHRDLLQRSGLYARLYNAQFDGRLPEAIKQLSLLAFDRNTPREV